MFIEAGVSRHKYASPHGIILTFLDDIFSHAQDAASVVFYAAINIQYSRAYRHYEIVDTNTACVANSIVTTLN
jgi:hypothetical protein